MRIKLSELWRQPFGVTLGTGGDSYVYIGRESDLGYYFYSPAKGRVIYDDEVFDFDSKSEEEIEVFVFGVNSKTPTILYEAYLAELFHLLDEPFLHKDHIKFVIEKVRILKEVLKD